MKNFARVVRLTLSQRGTLLGIVFSSMLVALLWGANIGVVYPFVEVVFQGKSMHHWVDDKIAAADKQAGELRRQIALLQKQRHARPQTRDLQREIDLLQWRLEAEVNALARLTSLRPHIRRYLPQSAFDTLTVVVGFLFLGAVLRNICLAANMVLVERLAQWTTFELRKRCFRRVLQLDLAAFGAEHTSELMSRFTNDMKSITGATANLFGKTVREPFKMAVCLIGAGMISWRLLAFSLLFSPVALFLTFKLAQSLKRAHRRALEQMSSLYTRLFEAFTLIHVVKAFTMERRERSRFHETSKEYFRKAMRISLYDSLSRLNSELLGMGVICLAMLAGGYLVLNQQTHLLGVRMTDRPLSFGAMMAFFAFLVGVSDPVRKMADIFKYVQRGAAAADRLCQLHDRAPRVVESAQPQTIPSPHHDLTLENVSFGYRPDQRVLDDITLRIPFGKTLAIVGPNGCGKSTLAQLIPRFYDPLSGRLCLNGVDLKDLSVRDLRRKIGVVAQQTQLFDDTVLNNIVYGSPAADHAQAEAAAKKAHADQFIVEQLERGYDTIVGEGGNRLSGGQRQRIALARAILRDPEILILDEATSQIDLDSEQLIHQALQSFVLGRTAIIITHRISTLSLADTIAVMNSGRLIDHGTHPELLSRCKLYRRLYQLGLRDAA